MRPQKSAKMSQLENQLRWKAGWLKRLRRFTFTSAGMQLFCLIVSQKAQLKKHFTEILCMRLRIKYVCFVNLVLVHHRGRNEGNAVCRCPCASWG